MTDQPHTPDASRSQLTLLWTQAQPLVMAFIRSMVANQTDAEDLLQQTAYDISMHFDQYDTGRPFVAWAIGIARFKVLSYRRDRGRAQVVFSDDAMEQMAVVYATESERLGDHTRALEICMRKLTDKSRTLIDLRYVHDLKPAAIAQKVGTSANTVSNALSRTREALRRCIERVRGQEGVR